MIYHYEKIGTRFMYKVTLGGYVLKNKSAYVCMSILKENNLEDMLYLKLLIALGVM